MKIKVSIGVAISIICTGCIVPIKQAVTPALFETTATDTIPPNRWAGCYRLSLPWWPGFTSDRITLDTVDVSGGRYRPSFRAAPNVEGYVEPIWEYASADWIVISWMEIHGSVNVALQWNADSLEGYHFSGSGLGSHWSPAYPRRSITAYRIPCDAPDAPDVQTQIPDITYDVISSIGLAFGAPLILSAPIGTTRLPGGWTFFVEPGLGGIGTGVGYSAVTPGPSARIQFAGIHTWGSSWFVEAGQTYLGVDARMTFLAGLGIGMYRRVHGSVPGDGWLYSIRFVMEL